MEFRFFNTLNDDIRRIRISVFIEEQGLRRAFDNIDMTAWHVMLYRNEVPIATGRMSADSSDPDTYHIGRIAVLSAYRELRVGVEVLSLLEDKIRAQGGKRIILSAPQAAQNFYEKQGYRIEGEPYFEDGRPYILMTKNLAK